MMESKTKFIDYLVPEVLPHPYYKLFVEELLAHPNYNQLENIGLDTLRKIVTTSWQLFYQIKEPVIEIKSFEHSSTPDYFIFLLSQNRPFTLDSLLNYLERSHCQIKTMMHPVLMVKRFDNGELHQIFEKNQSQGRFESLICLHIKAQENSLTHLKDGLRNLLQQVTWVVDGWTAIREHLHYLQTEWLNASSESQDLFTCEEMRDTAAYLEWLDQEHFVFLGCRYFSVSLKKNFLCFEDLSSASKVYGLFLDPNFFDKDELTPWYARAYLEPSKFQEKKLPCFSITKSNYRSPVHRYSRINSVEILDFKINQKGEYEISGIYQFIGLFTRSSFNQSVFTIPFLKTKVKSIFNNFGFDQTWYDGKIVKSILESIPQDELYHLDISEIEKICKRVFEIRSGQRFATFYRNDVYGRYGVLLVYLSKDVLSNQVKEKFKTILESSFDCQVTSTNVYIGDFDFARIIYVLSFKETRFIDFISSNIEEKLYEQTLDWPDYFFKYLTTIYDEEQAIKIFDEYKKVFSDDYKKQFSLYQICEDIQILSHLKEDKIDISFYEKEHSSGIKIFKSKKQIHLSDVLPILNNLGFLIESETTYELALKTQHWIYDFKIAKIDHLKTIIPFLKKAFMDIWEGKFENDSFNQLIIKAGLNVREIFYIRAYAKYLKQIQLPFSLSYIAEVFAQYPSIIKGIIQLFEKKFNPDDESSNRQEAINTLNQQIFAEIKKVQRLDHDRILRALVLSVQATVRTNAYQYDHDGSQKPYLSFKISSKELSIIPEPKPLYEIFIYSPWVEAIHLRGGKISRGGIRWSERFEDMRSEILSLMKAQMVKNAVIVPLGSKGGFIVKNQFHDKSAVQVVFCYQTMMKGLLDLTDNLKGFDVISPPRCLRYDEDDTYLVVAADKGTASFSDIANAVSQDYGYWLGDAFASGGSTGYDHKKIAITARGAWESVKRHFREKGLDVQTTPFTVVGVGDMSGDVFGNGMLQSKAIKLVAAINHQHIFLDPRPDPAKSYEERQRLFNLKGSTWADYNVQLLGGGIFERTQKLIPLSAQVKELLQIQEDELPPELLIQFILKAPVDLLWFGGIGTFIKASDESHTDVADRSNDALRINAKDVQAKVIAEGANLGMTQKARIEYALKGGQINTDAIDNSGGVDCSDHEVNIKIFFQSLEITLEERNVLLKEMTEEVADLVLKDNYLQTQILSLMDTMKMDVLDSCAKLMRRLEQSGQLKPALEFLPTQETLERRRAFNQGFTRPELAILLAYSKNDLYKRFLNLSLLEEEYFNKWLQNYFPKVIQDRFSKAIFAHPLQKEIKATVLVNHFINRLGPTFLDDIKEITSCKDEDIFKAYFALYEMIDLQQLWQNIEALDPLLISDVQYKAFIEINEMLQDACIWYLRQSTQGRASLLNDHFMSIVRYICKHLAHYLPPTLLDNFKQLNHYYQSKGLRPELAYQLSLLPYDYPILECAMLVLLTKRPVDHVAKAFFDLMIELGIDKLLKHVEQIRTLFSWQKTAKALFIDDLSRHHAIVAASYLHENTPEKWEQDNGILLKTVRENFDNVMGASQLDLGFLAYTVRSLEKVSHFLGKNS